MGSIVAGSVVLEEHNVPGHWTAEANGFFFDVTLGEDGYYTLRVRGSSLGTTEGRIVEGLTLAFLETGVDVMPFAEGPRG